MTQGISEGEAIDLEESNWEDFALCAGQPVSLFFEEYESSQRVARAVDEMCSVCPARMACLTFGIENKHEGTWGGVALSRGKMDKDKNSHKTPEEWQELRELLGGN